MVPVFIDGTNLRSFHIRPSGESTKFETWVETSL